MTNNPQLGSIYRIYKDFLEVNNEKTETHCKKFTKKKKNEQPFDKTAYSYG